MEISQARNSSGLLYPMMIIAAIAVIAFSIIGIASIVGWMPHSMVGARTAVVEQSVDAPVTAAVDEPAAFQCAECGVIQSVREIEQRGSLWPTTPVAAFDEHAQPSTTGL